MNIYGKGENMKKILSVFFMMCMLFATSASEYYDKPFIFPGTHRQYYKKHLEKKLYRIDFETSKQCAVKAYVDKDEVFGRALEIMKNAKKSILFNMYLFGGKIGEDVINIMLDKMRHGVEVYCVVPEPKNNDDDEDFFKSDTKFSRKKSAKPPYYEKVSMLVEKGIPAVFAETLFLDTNALVRIDHSKLIIVDGERAMVGGMNFADTVAANHDSMVEVVGPFVQEIEKIFINNWILGFGKNYKKIAKFNENIALKNMKKALSEGWIYSKAIPSVTSPYANNTKRKLVSLFNNAKKSIKIEQLLFNENNILKAVLRAAKRGVDVKVILDPAKHLYSMDWHGGPNNKAIALFQKLKKGHPELKVEARRYKINPGQELHMKLAIVDNKFVTIGSTNFTSGAMRSNYEEYFFFESPDLAEEYNQMFINDWKNRTTIPDEMNLIDSIIGGFSDIIF